MDVRHNEKEMRFDIFDDSGRKAGQLIYRKAGVGALFATHTAVEPEYEGKGYAEKLVDALAEYARREGFGVVPVCGYVLRKFRGAPERYADVWDEPARGL